MVRTGRDGIAGLRAHRARTGSLPFPSPPFPLGHCGREGRGRWCGPGRAAARFGGAGLDGAGAQRRWRRSGSGALEAPAPLPQHLLPLLRALLEAQRFPASLARRASLP